MNAKEEEEIKARYKALLEEATSPEIETWEKTLALDLQSLVWERVTGKRPEPGVAFEFEPTPEVMKRFRGALRAVAGSLSVVTLTCELNGITPIDLRLCLGLGHRIGSSAFADFREGIEMFLAAKDDDSKKM